MDLPLWPSKGNRRRLEALWLEKLERGGVAPAQAPAEAPDALWKAVDEFNDRLFWECHETLEDVWRQTPYPQRFFYHAIIKAAVGFYHLSRHNRHGARVKLSDAVQLLRLFQPHPLGIRTDGMLDDVSTWLARVDHTGPVDWAELDRLPKPIIRRLSRPDAQPRTEGPTR